MKLIHVSGIIFFFFLLCGCQIVNKQIESKTEIAHTTKDIRQIAWDSLTRSQQKEVIGDWKDAAISKEIADPQRFGLDDRSFEGQEVTMVTFRSSQSALLGDITILVDEKTHKVIGAGFRE